MTLIASDADKKYLPERPAVTGGAAARCLTFETAAYIAIGAVALALRLWSLGANPLSNAEAINALAAWRIIHGEHSFFNAYDAPYSPLLVTMQALFFLVPGATEFTARLGPAIAGLLLVFTPRLFRKHLSAPGAVFASLLLAVSPTAVYLSRTANGEIFAGLGFALVVAALFDEEMAPARSLKLIAAGLALGLSASPVAYTALLLIIPFLPVFLSGKVAALSPLRESALRLVGDKKGLRDGIGLLAALLAVFSTAFLFNLRGLGEAADMLPRWFGWMWFANPPYGGEPGILLLNLYEPAIILLGLVGLSLALFRHRPLDIFLTWWVFGSLVLDVALWGRPDGAVLITLLPLALTGGITVARGLSLITDGWTWEAEGLLFATGLAIVGYAYVSLAMFIKTGGNTYLLPLAALAFLVGIGMLFGLWYGPRTSARGLSAVGLVVLAMVTIATGWRLYFNVGDNYNFKLNLNHSDRTYAPYPANPYQPMTHFPASYGLPEMMETIERISNERFGDKREIDITVSRQVGPALEWKLRDFPNVVFVDGVTTPPETTMIVYPAGSPDPVPEGYKGQDFPLTASWSPTGLGGRNLLHWLIFRRPQPPLNPYTPVSYARATLWLGDGSR